MHRLHFKYDVAFSFLQQDEQLALAITETLRDRVNVFVYPERQDELIGVDGIDRFSKVFSEEARIVVILHRENWGQTQWTRLEETAIKNRGFDDGYDFVTFIPLESHKVRPKWIPQTRIWPSFDKYGIDGVASTIEDRVRSAGGTVHSETIVAQAARIQRDLQYKRDKRSWLASEQAIEDAMSEVKEVFNYLQGANEKIKKEVPSLHSATQLVNENQCVFFCSGYGLQFGWQQRYLNTIDGSAFYAELFKGQYSPSAVYYRRGQPRVIAEATLKPDLDLQMRPGWREEGGENRFFSSQQLVDHWLKELFTQIESYKEPQESQGEWYR